MDKYLKPVMLVITILGLAFVFAFTNPTEAHPLVDEFSDAVSILDKTIEKAILHKAAHPIFIGDLQEIAEDLRKALPKYWSVQATSSQEPPVDSLADSLTKSADEFIDKTKGDDDSLWGAIQKVVEGVSELPGLFNEIGDLFKENPAKPEPDTSSKSGPKEKSVTPKEAESAQKQISAQVESTTRKKAESTKEQSPPQRMHVNSEKVELLPSEPPTQEEDGEEQIPLLVSTKQMSPDIEQPLLFDVKEVSADYLSQSSARIAVLESYIELGPEGVDKIMPFLEDEDSWVVSKAIDALEELGPRAAPAVPVLMENFATDASNRRTIIRMLTEMGPAAERAVPSLVSMLHDEDLRPSILDALVVIDKELEQDAYHLLIPMLGESSGYGVRQCRTILEKGGERAVPALVTGLETGNEKTRDECASILATMGPVGKKATNALVKATKDPSKAVRRKAIRAVAKTRPDSPEVLATVRPFLQDDDSGIVYDAIWAIRDMALRPDDLLPDIFTAMSKHAGASSILSPAGWLIGDYGTKALPTLIEIVQQDSPELKGAIWALRSLGADGLEAVPFLIGRYHTADQSIQKNILWALGYIGGDASFELLKTAAYSPDPNLQVEALEGLGNMAGYTQAKETILIDLAKAENVDVKMAALEAMGSCPTSLVIDGLIDNFEADQSRVLQVSIAGLAKIGPPALEPLIETLRHQDPDKRALAIAALGEMGFVGSPALYVLDELAKGDPDEQVQLKAQQAMYRILQLVNMDLPLIPIPNYEDINELNRLDWEMAVINTRELMGSLMGEMSEAETALFEEQWEPFFRYPSQEMVEYLQKLNPLLMQFVALRSALVEVSFGYQGALVEAQTAAEFGAPMELDDALAVAEQSLALIQSLQRQMAIIAQQIDELGPLPDPHELAAKARKKLQDALEITQTKDLDLLDRDTWEGGKYWVLVDVKSNTQKTISGISNLTLSSGPPGEIETPSSIREGAASGSEIGIGGDFGGFEFSGSVSWTPLPRLIPASGAFAFPMRVNASFSTDKPEHEWLMTTSGLALFDGFDSYYYTWIADSSKSVSVDTTVNLNNLLLFYDRDETGLRATDVTVRVQVPGGFGDFKYTYELQELSTDQVEVINLLAKADLELQREEEEQVVAEFADKYQAAHGKLSALAFQREQAEYFKEQARLIRQELGATTDPEALKQLTWQLLVTEANRQGALDETTTLETGQWTRTPTAYDSYVLRRMGEQSREMAEEFAKRQRILNALPRQLKLAPPELKDDLTSFADRNLDIADIDKMQEVAQIVSERIQAYWEGEAARSEEAVAIQDENLFWAQSVKMAAGTVISGGAGQVATALGASAKAIAWAPTATKLLYAGTTGYIEGGPAEAVKQTISWSHQAGALAIEAYDGFKEGSKEGLAKGLEEAAWRAGQAYVMDKIMDYGTHLVGRAVGWAAGTPKPTLKEQFDAAKYKQEMDDASSLVRHWQDKQWELSRITASGITDARSQALSNEVTGLVASINSSYHAKWLLKHQAPRNVQALFNTRLDTVYASTMPQFYEQLTSMGYDTSNLKFSPVRNAASAGSVGMDLDLALDETTRVAIIKDGKQTDRFAFMEDAQKAWNRAYMNNTGHSAVQSDILVTTRAHGEAFAECALLSSNIDFDQIRDGHLEQAGDVFRTKVAHSLQSGTTEIGKTQAVCRDLEKEMRTKVMPYMEHRMKQEALRGNRKNIKRLQEANNYWEKVYEKIDTIGRQEINPYKIRQIERELEAFTGHKVHDLVEQMAFHFETLGKFYK